MNRPVVASSFVGAANVDEESRFFGAVRLWNGFIYTLLLIPALLADGRGQVSRKKINNDSQVLAFVCEPCRRLHPGSEE